MKFLVTGADGQLGFEVVKLLRDDNHKHQLGDKRQSDDNSHTVVGATIEDFDLTNEQAVKSFIFAAKPDVIIHCAAYTAVDKAESEPELCRAVNALGTKYVAEATTELDAKMIYISTDYVFDGTLDRPYEVDDIPNPLNVYGRTKLEGEQYTRSIVKKSFVVRTSWVFGQNGNNFVKTMLRLGNEQLNGERGVINVVSDQFGSPTYAPDLARLLVDMTRTERYGTYHATNEGFCSWFEFATVIFETAGMDVNVMPVSTEDYPTAAVRPKNSRLSKQNLAKNKFELLPSWQSAMEEFLRKQADGLRLCH